MSISLSCKEIDYEDVYGYWASEASCLEDPTTATQSEGSQLINDMCHEHIQLLILQPIQQHNMTPISCYNMT